MIQVIDYKAGNLTSVTKALRCLRVETHVTRESQQSKLRLVRGVTMQRTARLLIDGDKQAVDLPPGFRFDGDAVTIRKNSDTGEVILSQEPETFASLLKQMAEIGPAEAEFLAERDSTSSTDRNLGEFFRMLDELTQEERDQFVVPARDKTPIRIPDLG